MERVISKRARIDQYDLVELVLVPEEYQGVMELGDVGVVVEKYDEKNFEVECVQAGGYSKWLATLNVKHVRLRSKDPYNAWANKSFNKSLIQKSIRLGIVIGAGFGSLIGAGFGAIIMTLNGILVGAGVGAILGILTGVPAAALTAKIAGTSGGIGVGYFIGMMFGGIYGVLLGALIPPSLRMMADTEGLPVLDALMLGRFETAMLSGFLLSILATIVGAWVGQENLVPRDLENK
jgi:hypothetical protein